MRYLLLAILSLNSILCFCQGRIYSGFIDKYPIQLTTYSYSDGVTRAIYAYDKFDTPIIINGNLENDTLTLIEKNEKGEISAKLEFTGIDLKSNELNGKWINQINQTKLNIRLTKSLEFDSYDDTKFDKVELIQSESTKNNYFKLLISKKSGEDIQVTGVRVFKKKTDKLIQEIELECQFLGLNNISVGDYNFDGEKDFSVFEQSYAGPNTSSIYILRFPDSEKYFISDVTGTSLEFDYDSKLIYEHNQCCAGKGHMNSTYKIVDNKMVLIEKKCTKYNEEKEDFIDVECE